VRRAETRGALHEVSLIAVNGRPQADLLLNYGLNLRPPSSHVDAAGRPAFLALLRDMQPEIPDSELLASRVLIADHSFTDLEADMVFCFLSILECQFNFCQSEVNCHRRKGRELRAMAQPETAAAASPSNGSVPSLRDQRNGAGRLTGKRTVCDYTTALPPSAGRTDGGLVRGMRW
jgi:hypothetical protein